MYTRMIISIPKAVKDAIELASIDRDCSESEVVRTSLYIHLKSYLDTGGGKNEVLP